MFLFRCGNCPTTMKAAENSIGKVMVCQGCGHSNMIPSPPKPSKVQSGARAESEIQPNTNVKDDDDEDRGERKNRRKSRRHDRDDDEDRPARRGFRCPYCDSDRLPYTRKSISTGGWVVFAVMLLFCFPLFWIGLLMTEGHRECSDCGMRIGGG